MRSDIVKILKIKKNIFRTFKTRYNYQKAKFLRRFQKKKKLLTF